MRPARMRPDIYGIGLTGKTLTDLERRILADVTGRALGPIQTSMGRM